MTYLTNIEIEALSFADFSEAEIRSSDPTFLDSIHDLEEDLDAGIDVA